MKEVDPAMYKRFVDHINKIKDPLFMWSLSNIARETGLHLSTVSQYFYVRYGVQFTLLKRLQKQAIARHLKDRRRIAEVLHITESSVSQILKECRAGEG